MNALEHRIHPPLVALITMFLTWLVAQATPAMDVPLPLRQVVALFLAGTGAVIAACGVFAFRRAQTTINPIYIEQASQLVTGGIYRLTRNPMYLGLACVLLGWAVYFASPYGFLGPLAFIAFITRFQILPEERVMAAKFGQSYLDYRARVRRWL